MIIYLHGFDSTSPGNHEKVLQLQFIDPDVRLLSYSTLHPKHDMQYLLNETDKLLRSTDDERPLICGVGLGGFGPSALVFSAISARSSSIRTSGLKRTWWEKSIARKSTSIWRRNASAISARRTVTAAWPFSHATMTRWTVSVRQRRCKAPMRLSGTTCRAINLKISRNICNASKPLKPSVNA